MDTKKRKVWFYEKTPKNTLSASNDFTNYKKEGLARVYWRRNGPKASEGNFKNDKKVGIW